MKRIFAIAILLILTALSSGGAPQWTVSGRVKIVGRPAGAAVPTIVYAEPLDARPRITPRRGTLTQKNKSFLPHIVAVSAGSTVDFPNQDPIFHNVFSLSRPAAFDLGLYRAGASKSRTFTEPATYQVFCNIHPEMTAVILVLPTSYITEADAEGNYKLELPLGLYRITAWSERAQPVSTRIGIVDMAPTVPELVLDESKFVVLPHKNKLGQDYPKSAYDPLRDKKPL